MQETVVEFNMQIIWNKNSKLKFGSYLDNIKQILSINKC